METILKEGDKKEDSSIYLKIIINGIANNSVDKALLYLDITNDLDKIISERYPVDLDKGKAKKDLSDFFSFLKREIKLSHFLKGKMSVKHECLAIEGELYSDNIDIHKFKRNVILELDEVFKIGYLFFRLSVDEVKSAIGIENIKENTNKENDLLNSNMSFLSSLSEDQDSNNAFDPFANKDSNHENIKNKKAKTLTGEW